MGRSPSRTSAAWPRSSCGRSIASSRGPRARRTCPPRARRPICPRRALRHEATGPDGNNVHNARVTDSELVRERLAAEVGAIRKQAPFTVALAYPSPYATGMSSLGYQRIYRAIMETSGMACERTFLDDAAERDLGKQTRLLTYESLRPVEDLPVIAFSVAYEFELAGLVTMLDHANIPALREDRGQGHPFVL